MTKRDPDSAKGENPPSPDSSNPVEAAIGIVREAGRAVRDKEERTARAISDVEQKLRSLQEELSHYNSRAEAADAGLREEKAQAGALLGELRKARDEIAGLKDQVVARESDVAVMHDLADAAEKKALERSTLLSKLIEAIRLQLPGAFQTDASEHE
jgi:chromosome segregation ATPase